MSRLEELICHLKETTFFEDPASTKYHGSHKGGLYEHSRNVVERLTHITMMNDLKWKDRDSPQIIGLAHDMCKIGAYLPDGKGGYTYNEAHPKGHGSLSLELVSKVIDLTDEEAACIRWHMGAFVGKEKWRELQEATVNEPKILYVNLADNESTTYEIRKERGIF